MHVSVGARGSSGHFWDTQCHSCGTYNGDSTTIPFSSMFYDYWYISIFLFFFPSIKALEGFNDKNDRETYASPLMNASLFHFRSMAVFGFWMRQSFWEKSPVIMLLKNEYMQGRLLLVCTNNLKPDILNPIHFFTFSFNTFCHSW